MNSKSNTYTEGTHVYSYGTHVATIDHEGCRVIAHGRWSRTTTGHVNKVAKELGYTVEMDAQGQAGSRKVSADTFAAQRQGAVKEERREQEPAPILGVLRMFAALASMHPNEEEAQRQREQILFRTPGIIKPEGWDALPLEERTRRTKKALEASK